jgi:hypothetical protein
MRAARLALMAALATAAGASTALAQARVRVPIEAAEFGFTAPAPAPPGGFSAFAQEAPGLERVPTLHAKSHSISSNDPSRVGMPVLSAERAQILLRSLTVPGWGQATLGHNDAARAFIMAEAGIWASFVAFRIQQAIRTDSYTRSARINAGIDLSDRGEEYRRLVGGFLSSDDYNRLVVYRDAANLYYDDPPQYWAYIAQHELKGADTWHWANLEDLAQYRAQRKDSQRAGQRANTALALAVVNRFVSGVHAMRIAGRPAAPKHSWNFEMVPVEDGNLLAVRCGVRARF